MTAGWKAHVASQKQYTEIVNGPSDQCRRSDLTTEESLKLYATAYDPSTIITTPDQIFLTGTKPEQEGQHGNGEEPRSAPHTDSFVNKANHLGVPVTPHSELAKERHVPLFHFERRRSLPPGFEQINEEMFARKDNKFMVFNWAGVQDFASSGTRPVTKISHVEDILLTTIS